MLKYYSYIIEDSPKESRYKRGYMHKTDCQFCA